MFSTRTAWDTTESTLSQAIREARSAGRPLHDLTVSNPTRCGFDYPPDLLTPLTDPAALTYDPDPRGILSARQAVTAYYHQRVPAENILLTTSTSEAYSYLFRLLCNPGDQVLVAQPSYPLFDFLATLDDVLLTPYPLFYDFGWWIDFAELERRITPTTRALLLVHPNNPTGHATSHRERDQLEALCARHALALIVDEVFLDYSLGENGAGAIESFTAGPHPCLTFVVSGLSKIAALPQMKVAWLAALGPEAAETEASAFEAIARLEVIADTFLSMNAPAQHALPAWLAGREAIQAQILARVRANLATLHALLGDAVLPVAAGWSAVLRCRKPNAAERLIHEAGVVVHPGDFYGFPPDRFLVFSLLIPQEEFGSAVEKLKSWMNLQDYLSIDSDSSAT